MPIAGSPKKLALDIAEGFMSLSPPMLKSYTPADLKTIIVNLGIVARELRQEQIAQDDVMAAKAKNMKLSRLNQSEIVIRAYCKKNRIPI
jgi:ATP-dependent 26S proteasome regulatory subunit